GGVSRAPRPAVRLLHARHADDRPRLPAHEPLAQRPRDPRGNLRGALSLHRLPGDRQRGAGRRRDAPRRALGRGDRPAIRRARGKVRHVGEAVAMIAAESRYVAEDAVERIVVEYEPLPLITDMERALEAASPLVHEEAGTNLLVAREFARGDVDAALASAAVVVRERFRFHRHAAICMENRGCLAEYATGRGTLTLRSSAQCPGIVRDVLTDLLDMPEHQIRVIAEDVGGGFGAKASLYPEEIATCVMARRLGRPVKWIGDRREDLLATTHAWDEIIDAELGLDRDGAIVGLRAQVTADIGA